MCFGEQFHTEFSPPICFTDFINKIKPLNDILCSELSDTLETINSMLYII